MARQKKEYISLHVKADAGLMRRFVAYCEEVGQTKTTAFERIVTAFLDEHEARQNKQTERPDGQR